MGAFGWGLLAGSSLVIGAVIAFLIHIPLRVIGLIMGFGAGVLVSAVAFDLVDEAVEKSVGHGWTAAGLFAGCLVFFVGDRLIDHLGGARPLILWRVGSWPRGSSRSSGCART